MILSKQRLVRVAIEAVYTNIKDDFLARFDNQVGKLAFSETAARPLPNRNLFSHRLTDAYRASCWI